jgi:hypothetical protein
MTNENQPTQPTRQLNSREPQPLNPQATIYPNGSAPQPAMPQAMPMPLFVSPKPPVATPEPAIMLPSIPLTTDEKIAQATAAPAKQPVTASKNTSKKRLFIILATVIVILAIAGGVFYLVNYHKAMPMNGPADTSNIPASPYLPRRK